ncbi:non-ribosomal peptide synthase/polyketide synthase [Antrihabitans stalactiti]|uniref:non-ribosomal peptide synthase/polyketide synthase n=1 Tax=Antrihabitans stalactiti TaxID=2584121 RepID=UPI00146CA95C
MGSESDAASVVQPESDSRIDSATGAFPLSAAQRGIWFAQHLDDRIPISIAQFVDIEGDLDVELLAREGAAAARELGTGMLRIIEIEAEPFQLADDTLNDQMTHLDFRSEADPESAAMEWMRREYSNPVDILNDRLIESVTLRIADDRYFWYVRMHHIGADGFGAMTSMTRVTERYNAALAGEEPTPINVNALREIAEDDAKYRTSRRFEKDRTYWAERTRALPDPISLAHRSAPVGLPSRIVSAPLPASTTAAVQRMIDRHQGQSFAVVAVAAVAAFLARVTGQPDVVLSLPVSARTTAKLRRSGGMVSNAVPIRLPVTDTTTPDGMLDQVRLELTGALRHQRYRLEDIKRDAGISGGRGFLGPSINIMMFLDEIRLGPHVARLNVLTTGPVEDLSINIYPGVAGSQPHVDFEANPNLYSEEDLRAHHARFLEFLPAFASAPGDSHVADVDVLHADERAELVPFRGDPAENQQLLPDLLEVGFDTNPDGPAIWSSGATVSYRELHTRSNQLARLLIESGARPESFVALCLPRSAEALFAMWAVAKSGAAFVPIDPTMPTERVAHMLADSGAAVGITTSEARDGLPDGVHWLVVDDTLWRRCDEHSAAAVLDADRAGSASVDNAAYMIYTSGSTGKPKGVVVTHAALANFRASARSELGVRKDSRVLRFSSASFDASVFEMISAFSAGAAMVVAPPDVYGGSDLVDLLREQGVTHIISAPTLMNTVDPRGLTDLEAVLVGGDVCTPDLVERFGAACRFTNSYGPTETTIVITTSRPLAPGSAVTIGRPLQGASAVVLDKRLRPVPVGVVGELYLAGPGLARGYHNRASVSADRFVANPFGAPGERMYRSGDDVRWTADHELEFIGRSDFQVKIRGFRVELAEIDAALHSQPGVDFAVTVAHTMPNGNVVLASYVRMAGDAEFDHRSLTSGVADLLPSYMVPSSVMVLEHIPLTPSGKLDLRALPEPQLGGEGPEFRSPETEAESVIAGIVAAVLGVPRVSVDDSLFTLGVDSIVAMQIVARAKAAGIGFTAREMFEYKTISEIARISRQLADETPTTIDELAGGGIGRIPLSPIVHAMLDRGRFANFSQAVLLAPPPGIDASALEDVVAAVRARHDILRSRFFQDGDGNWIFETSDQAHDSAPVSHVVTTAKPGSRKFAEFAQAQSALAAKRLDPEHGSMLQVVWIEHEGGDGARLLLVAHHLVIDGVSWRILLPDLAIAWTLLALNEPVALPAVGTSFRRWAHGLHESAAAGAHSDELPFWEGVLAGPDPLLGRRPIDPAVDVGATSELIHVELGAADTSAVLNRLPDAFGCGVQDGLIAALAMALAHWRHEKGIAERSTLLTLEGHGREDDAVAGADLARTVGWFTSAYPVRLTIPDADLGGAFGGGRSAGLIVKAIKEQLRAVPGSGVGFGVLRYLDPDARATLQQYAAPQVSFNYLGRAESGAGVGWSPDVRVGDLNTASGSDMVVAATIDVNAIVVDREDGPRLTATFAYPAGVLGDAEMNEFADLWRRALQGLARHVMLPGSGGLTPSDVPLVAVTQDEIDVWERRYPTLRDVWSLSPLQSGLLFHARLAAESVDVYTAQLRLDLAGSVDAARLRRAARDLFAAHANLRTAFVYDDKGIPAQLVLDSVDVGWREEDLRELPSAARESRVREILEADRVERFDLGKPALFRMLLLHIGVDEYVLALTNHHIILDGWSMPLLVRELLTRYAVGNATMPHRETRRYKDYLRWLQERGTASEAVWEEVLQGLSEPTLLAPAQASTGGVGLPDEIDVELGDELIEQLAALVQRTGITLNTVVQSGWAVLLSRLLARDDIVFGSTVSGRPAELSGVEDTLGLFINTIPVRIRVDESEAIADLLARVQAEQADLLDHHQVGLSNIQARAGIGALFDTLTVFESYPVDAAGFDQHTDIGGMRVQSIDAFDATHYPVTLMSVLNPKLRIVLRYQPGSFERGAITAVAERLTRALTHIAIASNRPVRTIDVLSSAEREAVLFAANATTRAVPNMTLVDLFDEQVARTPGAPAVEFDGTALSYEDFDERANRLARFLIAIGIGPESRVGIAIPRSLEMLVGIYAIVKAGAAYVPIDDGLPAERIAHIVDLAAPTAILAVHATDLAFPAGPTIVEIDQVDLGSYPSMPIRPDERRTQLDSRHPAYVIFTSGSTGRPKGVSVSHAAIVNQLLWRQNEHRLDSTDVVLQKTPISFDVSVWELFWPLQAGATLVIAAPDGHRDPAYLEAVVRERVVTTIHFVPSMLTEFLRSVDLVGCPSLRRIITSGESLPLSTVAEVHKAGNVELHNLYGPTEAAIDVTHHVTNPTDSVVPIGVPVWNTQAFVLDRHLRPMPVGARGELYLAGAQLARGYIASPGLTAGSFVANPFGPPGARMYRTGDVVLWRQDALEYVGRSDFQVKLRGQRIELAEIETAILAHVDVAQCAVVVRNDGTTGDYIAAYVVPQLDSRPDEQALLASVSSVLPRYMVPSTVMTLDALPLTRSGKLDRRALPVPEFAGSAAYAAPETSTERAIAAMYAEVLGIEARRVGTADTLFDLGGNSLTAMRLVALVNAELGSQIGVRELFAFPTVAALATVVDEARTGGPVAHALGSIARPERIPLSPAQSRMWFINRFDPASGAYNVAASIVLNGRLDIDLLRSAIADVITRHEALRTVYPDSSDGPFQRILSPAETLDALALEAFSAPPSLSGADLEPAVKAAAKVGFDVTAALPIKVTLLRSTPTRHFLVVAVHHISIDGWSLRTLAMDLVHSYSARSAGESPSWKPLPVQYADYALWKLATLGSEDTPESLAAQQLSYWSAELVGIPEVLELPADRRRPPTPTYRGATVSVSIDPQTHAAAVTLARSAAATPFMLLHTAFALLLARLSGSSDIVIGTPVAGRGEHRLDEVVGMFVNTLVLRTGIDAAMSFRDTLDRVRSTDLSAYAQADLPFERLVEAIAPARSTAHHPVFQVVLALDNVGVHEIELPGLNVAMEPVDSDIAKFDLQLVIAEEYDERGRPVGATADFTYACDLFDRDTVAGFADRFVRILRAGIAEPDRAVGDIDVLAAGERRHLLRSGDAIGVAPMLLADVFARAAVDPDRTAIEVDGGTISYGELDERSNQLARLLIARGVGPESFVALLLPRSPEWVCGVWAVAKTGAAFVPVDPVFPPDRISFMLSDSGATCGIAFAKDCGALPDTISWLLLDDDDVRDDVECASAAAITHADRTGRLLLAHPAYMIYTSGSTGTPKGVVVSHAGLAAFVAEQLQTYGTAPDSRTLHFASPSFDASILELLLAFGAGATMVLVAPRVRGGQELVEALDVGRVTHAFVTPGVLATMDPLGLTDLRVVIVGGEACEVSLVRRWAPGRRMFNAYGPTESTIMATQAGPMSAGESVVIGTPITGTSAVVLDSRLHPVPVGVAGELYVFGAGLARAYHRRSALTAAAFVSNPYGPAGARMYRTGDLVRWSSAGALEYLGRTDFQVKVRGHRIELGEIDAALASHDSVEMAITVGHKSPGRGNTVVSYVLGVVGERPDPQILIKHLRVLLPQYMIPGAITVLDSVPLTAAGKVDTAALPDPVFASREFVAPRTRSETLVAETFAAVLDIRRIGAEDDFFELGGDSLSATRVVARLNTAWGASLRVAEMFDATTVSAIALLLDSRPRTTKQVALTAPQRPARIPLSPAQERLWFLNQFDVGSPVYNIPFMVRFDGSLDTVALQCAVNDVVERHESLRTVFPGDSDGAYQLILASAELDLTPEPVDEDAVLEAAHRVLLDGFDVTTSIPLRGKLFDVGDDRHVLVLVVHHIIADGASTIPLARDIALAYTARAAGAAPAFDPLSVQYADYALWQRELLGTLDEPTSTAAQQLSYWTATLADLPAVLELPTDRRRPATASYRGRRTEFTISRDLTAGIGTLARQFGATTFMVLHSALAVLLSRLAATPDVTVGTPIAGRGERELDDLIGMFVNTLVLRTEVAPDLSFADFLGRVRAVDLAAFANADVPFERVVEAVNPPRSQAYSPLFQVALSWQNLGDAAVELPGLTIALVDPGVVAAKFDVELTLREAGDGIAAQLTYATDLFDDTTAQLFSRRLLRVLDAVIADPSALIGEVDILDADERDVVMAPPALAPATRTLQQILATGAALDPARVAVRAAGTELTYEDLTARADGLARRLADHGVGPEAFVAVAFPRSIESIVAMWAVARSGAAFVPVDPAHPVERVAHILTDSGAVLGLTVAEHREGLPETVTWLLVDDEETTSSGTDFPVVHPTSAAYMIYTSGSTGTPKGVVVTHEGLASFCADVRTELTIDKHSRMLRFSSPIFDASLFEMIAGFSAGATLVVAPTWVTGGAELSTFLADERISHIITAPAALGTLDRVDLPDLRAVVVGGDVCARELVERLAPSRNFFNSYGPTETTMVVTMTGALDPADPITIGAPLAGTAARVLDSRLNPVPVGVVGELYLSGPGLARGYHERPALTASRFLADPYGPEGGRMYRTGDLVRWVDGDSLALDFVGRVDAQIQLRGLRIELGEVELALAACAGVMQAVAALHTDAHTGDQLVAYVVPEPGFALSQHELKDTLAQTLPAYMVPSLLIVLDSLPVTAVGKLDRKALPVPEFASGRAYRAPSSPDEEAVAQAFAELLGVDRISVDDSFFELGGNSLLATRLVARVNATLGSGLGVRDIFEHPTPAKLARCADAVRGSRGPALVAMPRPERVPLSPAQQRMWFLNRFDPSSSADNIPAALRLTGVLDLPALRAALTDVFERHETLRTVYPDSERGPYQAIEPTVRPMALDPIAVAGNAIEERLFDIATTTFDVTTEVPLRARLLRVGDDEHILMLVAHHICADGYSIGPMARDLMVAYSARVHGLSPSWSPLAVQYADYALWQRAALGSEDDANSVLAAQLAYWKAALEDLPEQLDLPADRPRPRMQSYAGHTFAFEIDNELVSGLRSVAARHDVTLFMVMHAAFAVLLARLSNTTDIAIGAPIAGRGEEALDDLVGMFVNTLVLRTDVAAEETFEEFLADVRAVDLGAFSHADVPFERLVEALAPTRSTARHPLFQVAMSFHNLPAIEFALPDLEIAAVDAGFEPAKFDLHLTIVERSTDSNATLGATFTYATDLFDLSTVARFAELFVRVLHTIACDPSAIVGNIDLLAPHERSELLTTWNRTAHEVVGATLPDLFAAQVKATPRAVALVADGEDLTYWDLDARVNSWARELIARGVGPGIVVALALPRSLDLVVAMYAVAKAGGIYVPVDPSHPAQRTAYVLSSAKPAVILSRTGEAVSGADDFVRIDMDVVDVADRSSAPISDADRLAPLRPTDLAYVIYTSGTTGRPKGVAVSHAAIVNQLLWKQAQFALTESDAVLLKTAATFDLSVWEFWCATTAGAQLVVAKPGGEQDLPYLGQLMVDHRITTAHFVPSMLTALLATVPKALSTLRQVVCIGEALPPSVVQEFRAVSDARLHNLYGPTEAAVSVTHYECDGTEQASVPIGVPEWNTQAYVLDARLNPVPLGVRGELYIAGSQLAQGYWGQPGETAASFVANPFGADAALMYRTGDLARWTATTSGAVVLDYVGRADFQVKLRGFRIELAEIEAVLLSDLQVSEAVVTIRSAPSGSEHLVAYVVAPEHSVSSEQILATCAERLPSYMVPSAVVFVETMPINVHGKLDRKSLPVPEFLSSTRFRAPAPGAEEIVASIVSDLLGTATVGADDSFFELGGNSLLATRLVARCNDAFDADVTVRDFFATPTIAALAVLVTDPSLTRSARPRLRPFERSQPIALAPAQERIWAANQERRNGDWNVPFALRIEGAVDITVLRAAAADVVARHEALRTRYPVTVDGPVLEIVAAADAVPHIDVVDVDEALLDEALRTFLWSGIDVTTELPLRIRLFARGANDFVLAVMVHHIAADGMSMGPLLRDVVTAYFARATGVAPEWSPLPVQYADYAMWKHQLLGTYCDPDSEASRQLAYWTRALADRPSQPILPTDRPRPSQRSTAGAAVPVRVDPATHSALVALAQRSGASLFMVLQAAFALCVSRFADQSDVTVATSVGGRDEPQLDGLVGNFSDDVLLRVRVDESATFATLLAAVRDSALAGYAHPDVSAPRLEAALGLEPSGPYNPLFQVTLILQRPSEPIVLDVPGMRIAPYDLATTVSKHELEFSLNDHYDETGAPTGIGGGLLYATALFDESTAQRVVDRFGAILEAIADEPNAALMDIDESMRSGHAR